MPIGNITQTMSTISPPPHRGVDVQTVFVTKQEDFQDHLAGTTIDELNTFKDQLNTRIGEINSTTTTMNGYADTASAGASTATTKAGEASTSASGALTSKNQAETFKNNASASATKASQWADNAYNVEVETGKYSAKHWAVVAENAVVDLDQRIDTLDSTTVKLTGNQTIAGTKTFTSFPVTPSLAPTADFEVANKQYVDRLNKISNSGTVDFNTITSGGLYPVIVLGSSANGMGTSNYYYVVVYKYSDETLTQVAYPYSTGSENKEVWTRTKYAGTWGRWTKVGGGHIAQVNTISNPSKAVGATWGKINFSNNEIETNSNEITYLAGTSNNFYLNSSGEYDFNIQIYVEPPLSGTNISVYLGLFDLGIDGLSDVLIGVANQNIIPGQHPSLNLSKIVKVTTSQRYYTLKWYFLDGNGVQSTLNLQTNHIYCWANCKRI